MNRGPGLCYLRAHYDLETMRSCLHCYRDRPQAPRAYTRELEQMLLLVVTQRDRPRSSLDVDDCEAYKASLTAPGARFVCPAGLGIVNQTVTNRCCLPVSGK